jgi:hypothetical protein
VRDRLTHLLGARKLDTAIVRELAHRDLYTIAADALVDRMALDDGDSVRSLFAALADSPGRYLASRLASALKAFPMRLAVAPDVRTLVADKTLPEARRAKMRLALALAGEPVSPWPRLPERERAALALGWLHRCMRGRS